MPSHSLKEDGRPATLWFWDDWFSSFDVRSCSLAARGLWIDILGIMSRAEIKGTLTIAGKQIDGKTLARLAGITEAELKPLLRELEDNKVFSRLEDGTIINRRMYGESKLTITRSEAGKKGAEARWQSDKKEDGKTMTRLDLNMEMDISLNKKVASQPPSEYRELADLLIAKIIENDPKAKVPPRDSPLYLKWVKEIRLCREADGRTEQEIATAILFSQQDSFWKANILSTAKLRKKLPTLLLQASREGKSNHKPSMIGATPKLDKDPAYWAEVRRLKAEGIEGEALTEAMANFKQAEQE